MRHTLANSSVEFEFDSLGAEQCALRFRDELIDYFGKWRSPQTSRATVCFPLLGNIPGGRYLHGDGEFEMGQHGFAKSMDFEVVELSDSHVVLELRDSAETRRMYPFAFRFRVRYSLAASALVTEYQVANLSDVDLPYSVGAHPFFSCPIDDEEGLSLADYRLEFNAAAGRGAIARSFGPPEVLAAAFSDDGLQLSLNDELFVDGAFCLTSPPWQRVRLRCVDSTRSVEMDLGSAPYLQVWSRPGESFVCLEPFYGAITSHPASAVDHILGKRLGTNVVAAGSSESHRFDITLHR